MAVRRLATAAAAALALAVLVAAPAGAAPRERAASLSPLESSVLADINAFRTEHELPALRLSAPLTLAARAHTEQMASHGYFAHESADGSAFWRRVQGFYRSRRRRRATTRAPSEPHEPGLAADRRRGRTRGSRAGRVPRSRRHGRHDRLRRPPLAALL